MDSPIASDGQDVIESSESVRGTANLDDRNQEDLDNNEMPWLRNPELTHSEDPQVRESRWQRKTYKSQLDINPAEFRKTIREGVKSGLLPRERIEDYEFAQWAFGPRGLPNLQILAFGDFSERG